MTFKIIPFPFAFSAPLRLINQGLEKFKPQRHKERKGDMKNETGEL